MNFLVILVIALVPLAFFSANAYEINDPKHPLNIIIDYCIQHADRAATGENVSQDLVLSGILSPEYNVSCAYAQAQHNQLVGLEKIFDAY